MDTVKKLVVKLQRSRTIIKCSGCDQLFYTDDDCAAHLLKSCIQFRSYDDYESRRNFATWLVDYFKTYTYDNQNQPDAVKINLLLNDNRIGVSKKASLHVNIPELSSSICCPVCHKFSLDAETCFEHLFSKCLYVRNNDTSRVREWFCEYFSTKTENNLNVLREVLSNYSASRILCKYCKTEAPDQESLIRHFPCPQRRVGNPNELMCEVCNYSLPDSQELMTHLISKHYRCHACGIWPKNGRADFISLRNHLSDCCPRESFFFRCPMCFLKLLVKTERDLKNHIINCRRERAERAFSNSSLYSKCGVINCTDQILSCDIDMHLKKHLSNGDYPSSRQKRSRISADDLNSLMNIKEIDDRRNSICICNGNVR